MQIFNFDRYATKREIDKLNEVITSELDDLKDDVDALKANQAGLMGGINSIKWLMTALLLPVGIMLVRDIFVDDNAEVIDNHDTVREELRILQETIKLQQQYRQPPQ